jgi:hypothetical protein
MPQPSLRDMLFADEPLPEAARHGEGKSAGEPWTHFAAAQQAAREGDPTTAVGELQKVLGTEGLESRVYLQTWHCLRALGVSPPQETARKIQGVVVEVALDGGLDLVAAYADHSARYFNYAGGGIIWEGDDPEIYKVIDALLAIGQHIVDQIGLWDGPRPSAPPTGSVRINLLTFGGLYLGQGEFNALAQDPLGGAVIGAAFALMQALIAEQTATSR